MKIIRKKKQLTNSILLNKNKIFKENYDLNLSDSLLRIFSDLGSSKVLFKDTKLRLLAIKVKTLFS